MATTRSVGYKVSASVWNAVLSSINDAGTIWSGAVAGTTISGSTISATTSLSVASAVDNGGLFINASGTNRPAISLGNTTSGLRGFIQADNNGRIIFYSNGSPTPTVTLTSGVSIGSGSVSVPGNCLSVEGGAIFLPDSSATDGINIYGFGGAEPSRIVLYSGARGAGATNGSYLHIGHNSSGGGAPGFVTLVDKGGGNNVLWADASAAPGMLRIGTLAPEEDGTPSDTSGTVVGLQSSTIESKDVLGDGIVPDDALALILATPVKHFRYKGGSYNGTEFHGIIAEYSPAFAMDPDVAHPAGRSFNPVSAHGISVQAIKALAARVVALEAR